MDAFSNLENLNTNNSSSFDVLNWKQKCYSAMNDDFNTPILIANLFEGVKLINQIKDNTATITTEDLTILKETLNVFTFEVLGLENSKVDNAGTDKLNAALELLIKLRKEARINKDFVLSDQIRDELAKSGIELKDGREGTTYSVK